MAVVVLVQHFFGAGEVGRGQHVDVAAAGEVGGDLAATSMPRPGMTVMLVNSGRVLLVGVRVMVTIFCPPISVSAWA